jgi:hypothetical protein
MTMTDELQATDDLVPRTESERREQAIRQLRRRRAFRSHVAAYVVMNVALWAIWLVIGLTAETWFPWPAFVTVGWGIGVVMNAWDVYMRRPITEDEIRHEMNHLAPRT